MFREQTTVIAKVALIVLSCLGIGFGVWLLRSGESILGASFIALWTWNAQRFALWLIVPMRVRQDVSLRSRSLGWQIVLAIICFLAAAVSAAGVYLWYLWPEEWQAGLVFILFGFLVFAPVTVTEIRFRKKLLAS